MAARAAYAVDQGRERRAVYAATGGAKPLKSHQTPYHALRKAEPWKFRSPTLHWWEVQPCKLRSPTMQVSESNHASFGVQPCKFRSPTMQVFDALGAFGLGLRGFLPSLTAPPSKSGIRVGFYFFPAFFSATRSGPMTTRKVQIRGRSERSAFRLISPHSTMRQRTVGPFFTAQNA